MNFKPYTDCTTCRKCFSGKCKHCPSHKAELEEYRRRTDGRVHELALEIWYQRTKPVEVVEDVESNSSSAMGGQSFLTPTPQARPTMTGAGSILDRVITTFQSKPGLVNLDYHSESKAAVEMASDNSFATFSPSERSEETTLEGGIDIGPLSPLNFQFTKAGRKLGLSVSNTIRSIKSPNSPMRNPAITVIEYRTREKQPRIQKDK